MNLERTSSAATQHYHLAAQHKINLSELEKDRLTTDYLFVLAITNKLELNQHDKGRLSPTHLAQLAVTEKIDLSQEDKVRLPTDLLIQVFIEGYTVLSDAELNRFTAEQLDYIDTFEANYSEALTSA